MLGWGTMRASMTGSMDARWGGATTNFDWRHAGPSLVSQRAQEKAPKGRPKSRKPKEEGGPTPSGVTPMLQSEPGPYTNQSHAEMSILPSDQSKSGMGSDSPVWSSAAEPLGYGSDLPRPAAHSMALPMSPMGTSLPWTPGRGVGPVAGPPRPAESGVLPASGAYGGMTSDSSIWPSSSTGSLGSDTSIYSSDVSKGDIGGRQDSTRRRAGMNQVALNQIGVVRRNGGWPGA